MPASPLQSSAAGAMPSALHAEAGAVRLAGIVEQSIVDGPGLRLAVFTQGCPHHCPGCHNPSTHAFDGGFEMTPSALLEVYAENPLLAGVTLSGGEPFAQASELVPLAWAVHAKGGTVWCYTGYTFETLLGFVSNNSAVGRLLAHIDVLVDGRFEQDLRDPSLLYRGSANQRVLDVKLSLLERRAVALM